jgi:hypothetical protein
LVAQPRPKIVAAILRVRLRARKKVWQQIVARFDVESLKNSLTGKKIR